MPNVPRSANHEEALARRAAEIRQQAVTDGEFMRQVREGIAALARGERGTPLRELAVEQDTATER